MTLDKKELSTKFNLLVFVAALGYFVDVYDIVLFMMVKNQSLMDIGITSKTALFDTGIFLHNWQMIGMLVGGIFGEYWEIKRADSKFYLVPSSCIR